MPTISTASKTVKDFPNKFISPFGNDPIFPLYSSVPLFDPQNACLPCVACGNLLARNTIIQQQADRFKDYLPFSTTTVETQVGFNTQ
jgi:hypothetical protein